MECAVEGGAGGAHLGDAEGSENSGHGNRKSWARLTHNSVHSVRLWAGLVWKEDRLNTIGQLECHLHRHWHGVAGVIYLVAQSYTWQELWTVVDLIDGKNHGSSKAQFSESQTVVNNNMKSYKHWNITEGVLTIKIGFLFWFNLTGFRTNESTENS